MATGLTGVLLSDLPVGTGLKVLQRSCAGVLGRALPAGRLWGGWHCCTRPLCGWGGGSLALPGHGVPRRAAVIYPIYDLLGAPRTFPARPGIAGQIWPCLWGRAQPVHMLRVLSTLVQSAVASMAW